VQHRFLNCARWPVARFNPVSALDVSHYDRWQRVLGVNLWGVINGVHAFTQAMIDQKTPSAIVNTGSKQGITCPPGDTAYNITKAGVKVLTEGLAHSLRNIEGCQVTAHLLVPARPLPA
jgi:NAD(P)-dependent dehydrogenase (short-subunit alcohol dehydrogenase family)